MAQCGNVLSRYVLLLYFTNEEHGVFFSI